MPQIARCHAVDVGHAPVAAGVEVQAGDEVEQALVGEIGDFDRQRLFIETVDIAADEGVQQSAQGPLPGIGPAHIVQFLLKSAERSQAVVLL